METLRISRNTSSSSTKNVVVETAFEQKRLQLEEARNRKATALVSSAERMLKSIEHKLGTFEDVDINGYMAGDRMIDSIRERVEEPQVLDKAGEAEGIQSQLRAFTRRPYASSRISRSVWMGRMSSVRKT